MLWGILFILVITIVFILWAIVLGWQITNNITSNMGMYMSSVIAIPILIIMVAIWVLVIGMLVNYFYYVAVFNEESIIKITFGLFFTEKVEIVELYRILSIYSTQKGLLQWMLNYGNICMKIQWSWEVVFKSMPTPKVIIAKIEEIKLHTTQERFS